jgi:hypothetical protein
MAFSIPPDSAISIKYGVKILLMEIEAVLGYLAGIFGTP